MTKLSTEQRPEPASATPSPLLAGSNARLVSIFGSLDEDGTRRVHYVVDVENREYRVLTVR